MSGSPLSRRALLGICGVFGVVGTGTLSACDLDPTGSSSSPAAAPPDPDQAIVDAARAELATLILRLSATAGAEALVAVHRVQLAALEGEPPAATRRGRPIPRARVATRERAAAHRFTHWALVSRNGDLARVLASIATGIRMQPAVRGSAT